MLLRWSMREVSQVLKRMLHSAQTILTKPVSLTGTEIQATETVNAKFDDFKMYGKTTQDGEPSPDNPIEIVNAGKYNEETGRYEIGLDVYQNKNVLNTNFLMDGYANGIRANILEDGGIQLSGIFAGKTKMQSWLMNNRKTVIHEDYYTFQVFDESGKKSDINSRMMFGGYGDILNGETSKRKIRRKGDSFTLIEFTIESQDDIKTYYPMLSCVTTARFIKNTDRNITITSPVPLTKWDKLIKRDGVWGWSIYGKEYKMTADEVIITGNNPNKDNVRLYIMNVNANMYSESKCNIFSCSESESTINIAGYHYNGNFAIYISNTILSQYGYEYDETLDYDTLIKRAADAYRELIRAAGGIQIVVDMQEEQAFYPLPDEEQILMNSLQSYYPTTIIRNTEDLEMEVTMKSLNILGGGVKAPKTFTHTKAVVLCLSEYYTPPTK